jgi:hypothetical protein
MKLTEEEKRIIVPTLIVIFKNRKGVKKAIKGYDVIMIYIKALLNPDTKVELSERSVRRCISHIREYPHLYGIFIMANNDGFFVPNTKEEASDFMRRWKKYMETMDRVYSGIIEYSKNLKPEMPELFDFENNKK